MNKENDTKSIELKEPVRFSSSVLVSLIDDSLQSTNRKDEQEKDSIKQKSKSISIEQQQQLFISTMKLITQHIQTNKHNKLPKQLLKKLCTCYESIFICHPSSSQQLLLNLTIALNIWKISSETNIVDFEKINHYIKAVETDIVTENFCFLKNTLPILKQHYINIKNDIHNSSQKQSLKKDQLTKINNRYILFLIVCIKQFYQKTYYNQAQNLSYEALDILPLLSSQKCEKISDYKFKINYYLYRINNKLNQQDQQLKWIRQCLIIMRNNSIYNHNQENNKKIELLTKLQNREQQLCLKYGYQQSRQNKQNIKLGNKIRITSLHQSTSKLKHHNNLQYLKQGTQSNLKGFKKKSMSVSKIHDAIDYQKTCINHKKPSHQKSATQTANDFETIKNTNKSFRRTDNTGSSIFKQTKPLQKYIKINKLQKKSANLQIITKNKTFNSLLSQLNVENNIQIPKQKACIQSNVNLNKNYLQMLNQRPNQAKIIQNDDDHYPQNECQSQMKIGNNNQLKRLQSNDHNYQYIVNPYQTKLSMKNSSTFGLTDNSLKKNHKIVQAINYVQREFITKFMNNYERISKKKNASSTHNLSSSLDDLQDSRETDRFSSGKLTVENICGPRQPRNKKQKIFHTIQEVLIPNTIIPGMGYAQKIKAGVSRMSNKKSERLQCSKKYENQQYVFHVKIFTQRYGTMYGQKPLTQLLVDDGLSLQQQLMNMAKMSPSCFSQKAEHNTNICGYALQYLLLCFMKRFFIIGKTDLGRVILAQDKAIQIMDDFYFSKFQKYYLMKIYEHKQTSLDCIWNVDICSNNNQQNFGYTIKKKLISLRKNNDRNIVIPQELLNDSSSSLEAEKIQIATQRIQKTQDIVIKTANDQITLLGQQLYLPALIYQICTQASFTFKQIQPKIHAQIISCFFMTRQPNFMNESFLRSMKFLLINEINQNQIINLYFQQQNYYYMFRLSNNRQYIVEVNSFKVKSLYLIKKFHFIKLAFEQKNHRSRRNKLVLTSKDIQKWTKNKITANTNNCKTLLYDTIKQIIPYLMIRKQINSIRLGLIDKGHQNCTYFESNNFKPNKRLKSGSDSFLSKFLSDIKVIFQKTLKIGCFKSYGIISVINVGESDIYDFYIYIPQTQNYLGFSVHSSFLGIKNLTKQHQNEFWSKIINGISFQLKVLKQKSYYVARMLEKQIFIQDNIYFQYFKTATKICKIIVHIDEKRAAVNFINTKSSKIKINRLKNTNQNQTTQRKPFSKIYASQSAKYMIYLSISDTQTGQTLHYSYYLKQLLSFITSDSTTKQQQFQKTKYKLGNTLFNQQIIQNADLKSIYHMLSSSYIKQLSQNTDKYSIGFSNKNKIDIRAQKSIFCDRVLQQQLRNTIQKQLTNSILNIHKNDTKISLNHQISKNSINKQTIIYLYKHLQQKKKHKPIQCIMYDQLSQKFILTIDDYQKGILKIRQVNRSKQSMPYIALITKNRNILLGCRNRIAKFWENLIIVS